MKWNYSGLKQPTFDHNPLELTLLLVALAMTLLLLSTGCTYNAQKRAKVKAESEERLRELIQSGQVANQMGKQNLQATNYPKASIAYDLSSSFLSRGQSIAGLPIVDQTEQVKALLSENRALREGAERAERRRTGEEEDWRAEKAKYEAQLLEMGAKYEAEHNKSLIRRIWTWALSTFGIAGLIALCIFCPAAIPIVFRIGAWAVNKIPSLASGLGVVSKKTLDKIVIGVEQAKKDFKENGHPEAEKTLMDSLSKTMDDDQKRLIKTRKAVLAV